MPNNYQSEAELESSFMKRLNALGYQTVKINNDQQLEQHFRNILNQRNQDNLNGTPLTDKEFQRIVNEMVGSRTIYQIGQLLRGSDIQPDGKIAIQRDDNSPLYLNLFDGKSWKNNTYEIAHQITVNGKEYENRYDVTILINGLPVVSVELKRRGVDFTQAFNQIVRYRDESFRRLFRFIQIFIVSNGDETRYFANSDGVLNSNFMFYWTDEKNNWLNDIDAFSASFLVPKRLHSMISRYTIFDNSKEKMMIMRPYQVYATEAIINQAENHPHRNGFIWHTTGSGKTITAFKASQIMARMKDVSKVIFLIDRADLDTQTAKNFNSYLPLSVTNEPAIDRTKNTRSLVKQLNSNDDPLIISTIQKMNVAVTHDNYKRALEPYRDKRVIFIEDEAHRSQFGKMRKYINNWFQNAEHFGFTGTPIFKQNVGKDGRTTQTLYDDELHQYLIKDAIRDHNVLGFNVQYIRTIKGKDKQIQDKLVAGINTQEAFENKDRMTNVVKHILLNHYHITRDRQYNAIFTVSSTRIAIKYYKIFKEFNKDLNIATIFTWAANEDDNEQNQETDKTTSRHGLEAAIRDYNKQFSTDFDTKNFSDYFSDVSKRMKDYNAKTPDENIDILIVVNMFLTGFDSPKLSTLYVDRKLKWQGLLQAFSRTNRIEKKTKPFGNIVAYRNIKQETDDAVTLFSAGDGSTFFVPQYGDLQKHFNKAINDLFKVTPTPNSVDDLYNEGEDQLKNFVLSFREILRVFNKINVYDEFQWDDFKPQFSQQQMEQFRSKYYEAYRKIIENKDKPEKDSILDDINFEMELLETDKINVEYIVNLIKAINLDSKKNTDADRRKITRILTHVDNDDLKSKADLLQDFLDKVVPHLDKDANVGDELNKYLAARRSKEIEKFSKENNISKDILDQQMDNYNFYGDTNSPQVMDELNKTGYGFLEKKKIKDKIKIFVGKTIKRFTMS